MAVHENGQYFLSSFEINVEVEAGTLFFTYCHDCKKALYCATTNTPVTRHVATVTMNSHNEDYDDKHTVLIIKNHS